MATITRLKAVEQNKEFDRVLVRQLNFRTNSNNPIPANQVLFADGSGGTYWADPSGNYSCRAFNIFRGGTNGNYFSTVATGASNILKFESGYGIGMYKSDIPDSNSIFIYNTGPSRIQTQAGFVEFSSLSTTTSGRVLNFVGLGNMIVTASSSTVFFEAGGGASQFSSITADSISTNILNFQTGVGNTLTLSSLTVSSFIAPPINVSSASAFSGSSLQTSSIFATNLDTSTLLFSTGIGNNLSISSLSFSTGTSLYFQTNSLSTNNLSTNNLNGFYGAITNLSTNNLSTNNLVTNFGNFSTISTNTLQTNNGLINNLSTNNLSTNNLIGFYGAITNLSTNNLSTNNLIGNFGNFSTISTNNIQNNSISSINGNFISSFANSMVISSLVVSSINISTAIPIGSTLQLSTLNGFSSPIITMHWETGNVGINLGQSTPQTTLDVNGIIYAQNIVTYSDQRLKENFEYANFDLDLLTNLRTQRFEWKADHRQDFGLIAQQVEAILPECVETDYNGYKLVSYQKLVPVAFDLIYNLACKVSTLENHLIHQNT